MRFMLMTCLLCFSAFASESIHSVEKFTNRAGADYSSIDLETPDVGLCKAACETDDKCQAFSFVHPGVQAPKARCWLKTAATAPNASNCCDSGVKEVTRESGFERSGGDYMNFDLPTGAKPKDCEARCVSDSQCAGFTYMHPYPQRAAPHCWLKKQPGNAVRNDFCESGTVTR